MLLQGSGTLRADGADVGRVDYKFTVTERNGVRRADGHLWGGMAAIEAFGSTETSLVRDDCGYEMTIVITQTTGDGMARFAVSGDPGPLG